MERRIGGTAHPTPNRKAGNRGLRRAGMVMAGLGGGGESK